jgi:hypothetical protein
LVELSFLLTAAGQFRIFTGFPFKPDRIDQAPQSIFKYSGMRRAGQTMEFECARAYNLRAWQSFQLNNAECNFLSLWLDFLQHGLSIYLLAFRRNVGYSDRRF